MIFFFKQKTAYEMRISDWSSDVCSSDLASVASKNTLRIRNIPMTVRRDDNPIPMKYRVLGGRPSSRTTIVGVRAVVAELGGFVSQTSAERHAGNARTDRQSVG